MSANLFKVGDKVRIKSEIKEGSRFDRCTFVDSMMKYKDYKELIIHDSDGYYYHLVEDGRRWSWTDEFFEPAKKDIFAEQNAILLANGEIRLVHEDRLYLPNGTSIGCEVYEGRKHSFDNNFDIVEVHEKATGNYLFELSGELIKED